MKATFWNFIRRGAGPIGFTTFLLGLLTLIVAFFLALLNKLPIEIVGLTLGLFSVGLGSIAIDRSFESDEKYTALLKELRQRVIKLPAMFKNDMLSLSGQLAVEIDVANESKESAQRRLEEDAKKVGYVRGELYQLPNKSWAIHWRP